jgi:hypothetical protein
MPHGIKGWGFFIIAQAGLTFAWHMGEKLAEHAMLTWSDDQIANFLGLSSPSAPTVISWAIPAFLGFITLLAYHAVQPYISPFKAVIGSPLQIEFESNNKYERTEQTETGIFRRLIHVSVFNESMDDISDCNIRLIAASPRPHTGDNPTDFPVFFGANFDLRGKQRKFIQIVRFAENPGNGSILERDHIIISAAVGGFFLGWTTIPIPSIDIPAILTLEASAPSIASRMAHLHIYATDRRIHASIT